jgi:hypothetical protein
MAEEFVSVHLPPAQKEQVVAPGTKLYPVEQVRQYIAEELEVAWSQYRCGHVKHIDNCIL